jgi:hypothetical protein
LTSIYSCCLIFHWTPQHHLLFSASLRLTTHERFTRWLICNAYPWIAITVWYKLYFWSSQIQHEQIRHFGSRESLGGSNIGRTECGGGEGKAVLPVLYLNTAQPNIHHRMTLDRVDNNVDPGDYLLSTFPWWLQFRWLPVRVGRCNKTWLSSRNSADLARWSSCRWSPSDVHGHDRCHAALPRDRQRVSRRLVLVEGSPEEQVSGVVLIALE